MTVACAICAHYNLVMGKQQDYNRLYHCVYSLNYHLVLCTKYRRKCITKPMLIRLREILNQTLKKWDCMLAEFNGEADHVHLLISVNPKVSMSGLINNLKTVSSRLIRKEFGGHLATYYRDKPVFWSRSYCIITCGGAPLTILKKYIEQQQEID